MTTYTLALSCGLWLLLAGCGSTSAPQTDGRFDGPPRDGIGPADRALTADGVAAQDAVRDGPRGDAPRSDGAQRDRGPWPDAAPDADLTRCGQPEDCRLFRDNCGTCTCSALGVQEKDPVCYATRVSCFADPCLGKQLDCNADGHCALK